MIQIKYVDGEFRQELVSYSKTFHCATKSRVTQLEMDFPNREIVCMTMFEGKRNFLLRSGVLMVLDPIHDILITAYPVKWRRAQAMCYQALGSPPPQYLSEAIYAIRDWDKKHGYT